MSLSIVKAGVLDSFQDLGRNSYRKFGINPNGAMDKTAVRLLNILLGNSENEAVLEMHFPASEIKFIEDTTFAIGGADFEAKLGKDSIENWKIQTVRKGQTLKFLKANGGKRCYIVVKGGYDIEKWLGSSSTNLTAKVGGFKGRKLKKGDKIRLNSTAKIRNTVMSEKISRSIIPHYSKSPTIRIVRGAEYKNLTALSEQEFLSNNFKISNRSDRMGFRVEGKQLHLLNRRDMISAAVDYGTIQLLRDGQMVILMADHQTTGGYPRIAHVISQDLPLVAQLGAGDSVSFHVISHQEAEELVFEFEKNLSFLKAGIKFRNKG